MLRLKLETKCEFSVTVNGPSTKCQFQENPDFDETLEEPSSLRTTSEKFNLDVIMKYSSDVETSQGYSRQLTQKCRVTLHQSLITSWWDILPGNWLQVQVLNKNNLREGQLISWIVQNTVPVAQLSDRSSATMLCNWCRIQYQLRN